MTVSEELAREYRRESDSCLYTSTTLFLWLRWLRIVKLLFIVGPLICGGLAGWNVLKTGAEHQLLIAVLSLVAGLSPSIYSAIKYDQYLEQCKFLAAEFKNLQDRFRQLAIIATSKTPEELQRAAASLMDRLEKARAFSVTPPEIFFRRAQAKIKAGHYDFDDEDNR